MNIWVYKFEDDDAKFYEVLHTNLPKEIIIHSSEYQDFRAKFLSLLGYFLAYQSYKLQYPNRHAKIKWNQFGKPYYLESENDFYFNFSHSNEFLAFVFGSCNMGIDIESKDKNTISILQNTIQDYLNINELEDVNKNNPNDVLLLKYWTAKESVMKLIGKGMWISPNKLLVNWQNNNYSNGFVIVENNAAYPFQIFENQTNNFVLSISSLKKQFFKLNLLKIKNYIS
ncbi:MAG: hypothetical protein OHK0038_22730 [Flammeovirgaceae bacterium]